MFEQVPSDFSCIGIRHWLTADLLIGVGFFLVTAGPLLLLPAVWLANLVLIHD